MGTLGLIFTGLVMGLIFGFALEKSRVFEPGMIVGQLQFKIHIMLKVFLTAIATGALAMAVLTGADIVSLHPKSFVAAGNIIGGLVMGAGIALAGACPGTVLAQVGAGYKDAIAILIGGVFGAMVYGYWLDPFFKPAFLSNSAGKVTLADKLSMPYAGLAVVLAGIIALILFWLEKKQSWKDELGENFDGHFKD